MEILEMRMSFNLSSEIVADAAIRAFLRFENEYLSSVERADGIVTLVRIADLDVFDYQVSCTRQNVAAITKVLRERQRSPVAKAMAQAVLREWLATEPWDDDELVVALQEIIDG